MPPGEHRRSKLLGERALGNQKLVSRQSCNGPIKILGGLRYLNCALIYQSKGTEVQPCRDELCAYIDRASRRR